MFTKPGKTNYPPSERPVMVWDGQCGFCAYWIVRWQKMTGQKLDYRPYQEAAGNFPDIDIHTFKQASQLIETDGKVYTGPHSAYRTLAYGGSWSFLERWYRNYRWFRSLSDKLYSYIAKHRPAFFRITKLLFGSNPEEVRPFWVIYLVLILYLIYIYA